MTLVDHLQQACQALGLRADIGFVAKFDGVSELQTVAQITGPSCDSRMLIFRNYDDIRTICDQIVSAGYGYSVMDEPRSDEPFDLESWREVFQDWSLLPD